MLVHPFFCHTLRPECCKHICALLYILVPCKTYWTSPVGIIVVMGHSHYGPVVMVHMVVVMVHLGKSLWSTWKSRYGPSRKGSGSSPNQVCLGVLSVIPAIF